MATNTTVSILDNVFHAEMNVYKAAKQMQYLATMCISYGAGEVLLTSVDREGTRKGFDISLYSEVNKISNIPIIASGGMGNLEDLSEVLLNGKVDAVAMADALHYNRESIGKIRDYSKNLGFKVRDFDG